jgi:peptide/nickel transport system substrate-binding protein/microcin C transport system substrate-binding protein
VPKFDTLRSLYLFYPVQKKSFDGEADYNKARAILNPVGNGPYVFKTLSRDQKVELERNKEWWGNSLPHMKNRYNADKIVFRVVTDPSLEYERFLKGDLDLMVFGGNAVEVFAKKVKGTDKDKFADKPGTAKPAAMVVENKAPRGFTYIGWNLAKPMFASKKTRQALAHLADTKEIADKVFYGYAYQSTSPFGSLTMNSDPSLRKPGAMISYDVKKAIQLLKDDGWADSDKDNILDKTINGLKMPFRFELKYNSNNPARGKIAQILKENFKKAGIDISIRSMEWNAYLDDINKRQFDAIVMAWTATPYPNPRQIWHTESEKNQGSNFGSYSNKNVDELIDKANTEFDLAKRAKVLHEINRILYDEQPYTWLVEPKALVMALNPKVKSQVWAMTYDVDPPVDIYQYQ